MRHLSFIFAVLFIPLGVWAQSDTVRILREAEAPERTEVREESFATEDTPELQATPDSLVRVEVTTVHYYTDTLTRIAYTPDSVPMQREEVIHADSADRRGHYVEAHVGLGYGTLGYRLAGPEVATHGSFSALLQAQYAYFFHQNWGVGAGLWFTNYVTYARLSGTYVYYDQTDSDTEQHYDHTADVHQWREREAVYNLGIPISLQFQYHKEGWKAGIFASLGIAPSFSISKKYKLQEAHIHHSAYYPAWDLTLDDMHEFGERHYENEPNAKGKLNIRTQADIFADLGALIPLTPQIELLAGGYFHIALNAANNSNQEEQRPLEWKTDVMEHYQGLFGSSITGDAHPWEVGVKVGIHWRYIEPDIHQTIDYFDYFTRQDTMVDMLPRYDTILTERIDTLTRAHIAKAAEEVEKFNKIYFDFDSHRLSEESKDYLSSIVGVLNEVPDAKIAIDGHASEEGQRLHNERLAYNRAKAVAKFLVKQGIDKERVIVIGHGSLVPNEENINHELPLDRRVEVKVVQKQSEIE